MEVSENFLTKLVRNLLNYGVIQVVRDSFNCILTTGMSGTVGVAINMLWDLLQEFGGQMFTRLSQRSSNNSVFSIIRDAILNFITGRDYRLIRVLAQKALQFLLGLMGRAINLNPYATKSINNY